MVIRVAKSHTLAGQSNVIDVEIGQTWAHHGHSDHRTEGGRDDWHVEDQCELADLVAELDDKRVAIRNEIVVRRKLWIGHVLIERVDPAVANGDTLQVDPLVVHQL